MQVVAIVLGLAIARAARVAVSWDMSFTLDGMSRKYGLAAWFRTFVAVVVLLSGILPGLINDYGISVWLPDMPWVWILVGVALITLVSYPLSYYLLRNNVGPGLPFSHDEQLRTFFTLFVVGPGVDDHHRDGRDPVGQAPNQDLLADDGHPRARDRGRAHALVRYD